MDIRPSGTDHFVWDPANLAESLQALRKAVEVEGQNAIDWYWKAKRWKCRSSQVIQFSAVGLTALAGLAPVLAQLLRNQNLIESSGLLASLFVGIAAALVAIDKAFGYSSGWTRYVLTATAMTKQLHEFRMDWIALTMQSPSPGTEQPSPVTEQHIALIQRAKDFISAIQGMVLQETRDWATEFQSNMAQMEKDLKVQLDSLKAQVDQDAKNRQSASAPGALELTVTNADKTDGFAWNVVLEGQTGTIGETVSNSKVWSRIQLSPGQYIVRIASKAKGTDVGTSAVLDVKPGETTKPSLMFPI